MTKMLCDVYKTRKKDEMYLYVSRAKGLDSVPAELMELFGKPELAMTMVLTEEKKLARADIHKVLADLDSKGFYLQLPPVKEQYMLDLFHKLDRS